MAAPGAMACAHSTSSVVSSSTDYADRVVDEIRAADGKAIANYDTVATPAGGESIIRAATEHFGRVDVVINNAGNQRNVRFGELTEQDIDAVYAVHVKGTFFRDPTRIPIDEAAGLRTHCVRQFAVGHIRQSDPQQLWLS
jgi:NAD(P)-dependent dehydrogenase (short-subunit alcohol dehydrogenase family)